jgi:hypothetical protein
VPYLLDITGFSGRSRRVRRLESGSIPATRPFHLQGIYDRVLHAFESLSCSQGGVQAARFFIFRRAPDAL